jgi:hypothetical protein
MSGNAQTYLILDPDRADRRRGAARPHGLSSSSWGIPSMDYVVMISGFPRRAMHVIRQMTALVRLKLHP